MKRNFASLLLLGLLCTGATSQPATQPDLSTPKRAVIAYLTASSAGDPAAAKAAAIYDDALGRMIDAHAAARHAKTSFIAAVRKHFGDAAAQRLSFDISKVLIQSVEKASVHLNGNHADIGDDGDFPCTRINGEWRYDLIRLHRDEPVEKSIERQKASAEVDAQLAREIPQGGWTSVDEVIQFRASRIPPPPPPPEQ